MDSFNPLVGLQDHFWSPCFFSKLLSLSFSASSNHDSFHSLLIILDANMHTEKSPV